MLPVDQDATKRDNLARRGHAAVKAWGDDLSNNYSRYLFEEKAANRIIT